MSQLPDLTFFIIKDLVFAIVLVHILPNHFVVDDGGSDRLLVLLNLLLVLEGGLDLGLHR